MVVGHLNVCACECHLIIYKELYLMPQEMPWGGGGGVKKVKLFVFNLGALITVVEEKNRNMSCYGSD